MKLAVFSYKTCWSCPESATGYATDGGFAFQMRALSELFDATTIAVPVAPRPSESGQIPLEGRNLRIVPLTLPAGSGLRRKLAFVPWLARNAATVLREVRRADAVHAPIPADIGTIGMLLAFLMRKPLLVRYCGNWQAERTLAERLWKRFMEFAAGGRNVMLATGGAAEPPSRRNPRIRWIFSTTLTERELESCAGARVLRPGGHRLITVCRQEPGKNTDLLVDALKIVVRTLPGTALDVVGDGVSVPELKRQARALGLEDRVVFHGKVNHTAVMRLLHAADLFVYPTASEGFPKAVLEALASGLPVVTTPVSVLPSLVGGGCGVLLRNPNAAALAGAIVECLTDAERYRAMSANAVRRARDYSLESWRDTIGAMLRQAWGPLNGTA
jgi:glycosyltransferase involved in cell wall biosynthesis